MGRDSVYYFKLKVMAMLLLAVTEEDLAIMIMKSALEAILKKKLERHNHRDSTHNNLPARSKGMLVEQQ
jgi:hypothetical protein